METLNHGLADFANVVDVEEGVGGGIVDPEGAAISDSDSDEGSLKVILMEIMMVFFLKIVRRREQLQLMMVLMRMNLWLT